MSEWTAWLGRSVPDLRRRVLALDAAPVRRGGGVVGPVRGGSSPARDSVIALRQDAVRMVREREGVHREVLGAGAARLQFETGCQFLVATAHEVEAVDFDALWVTGRVVTGLLARLDQVEGVADTDRVVAGLDEGAACPGCGHTVVRFRPVGWEATCLRCGHRWEPPTPLLRWG